MGFNECDNCHAPIIWDKQKRQQLNTKRPLNRDGTIHLCGGNGQQQQQQQAVQQPQNKVSHPVVDQDQRSKDIKDAQAERKKQHVEFIKNLQWNTKMQALRAQQEGGYGTAAEILDGMGFEEYREDQRQEGYEDL